MAMLTWSITGGLLLLWEIVLTQKKSESDFGRFFDEFRRHLSQDLPGFVFSREQKIFPLALVNYVASCGTKSRCESQQPEIHTMPELIKSVSLIDRNHE